MTKIDRLLMQHLGRDHLERNEVPSLPETLPLVAGRRCIRIDRLTQRREAEWRVLKDKDGTRRKGTIVDEMQLGGGYCVQDVASSESRSYDVASRLYLYCVLA